MSEPSTSKPASASASAISSVQTRQTVQSLYNIDLVGRTAHQISGVKLPSNRQVLQVFFHNMRFVKLDAKESAKLTLDAVYIFWQQARIPTRYGTRCAEKLLKLYNTWKDIQKVPASKRSVAWKQKELAFTNDLDNLFDIATADALKTIRIEEDKKFLIRQRQPGRPGCMIGCDMVLFLREKRASERKEKEKQRKRKFEEMSKSKDSGSYLALCHFLSY